MNTKQLIEYLAGGAAHKALQAIYPGDASAQQARYARLAAQHQARFGDKDELIIASAPGRTEIAGNHTDHNHGRVLAAAVSMDTLAAASKRPDGLITLHSEGYDEPFMVDLSNLDPQSGERETTSALIRGIAARMTALGRPVGGFDAVVTSTVLRGSGLSSSAAFEVMLVELIDALYGTGDLDAETRAKIAQYAENVYFGKPSGLLDQMASSVGGLVTMDFKDEDARIEAIAYDFAQKGYAMAVVAAGGEHGNLTSHYAAIPQEMREVARHLGAEVLRQVPFAAFEKAIPTLKGRVSDRAILRAMHFYDEDARVERLVEALRRDDLEAFFEGIVASGESSWKLLQNLYVPGSDNQEMSLALELSRRMLSGRGAWRIHGGGFAGTILAFVPHDQMDAYAACMNAVFGSGAVTQLSVRPAGPSVIGK
jgi:galactokinase